MSVYISITLAYFLAFFMCFLKANVIYKPFPGPDSIRPISCRDEVGNSGVCMFSLACRQSRGKSIGICKDSIYAGSCCQLNDSQALDESKIRTEPNGQTDVKSTSLDTFVTQKSLSTAMQTTISTATESIKLEETHSKTAETPTTLTVSATMSGLIEQDKFTLDERILNSTSGIEDVTTEMDSNEIEITETIEKNVSPEKPDSHPLFDLSIVDQNEVHHDLVTASSSTDNDQATTSQVTSQETSSLVESEHPSTSLSSTSSPLYISLSSSTSSLILSNTSEQNLLNWTLTDILVEKNLSTTTQTTTTIDLPKETTTKKGSIHRPYINKLDCGISPLKSVARVVGGRNAQFGEWPWQVLIKEATWLGLWMKTKCGGVLIDHSWVLTAAHCQPGFWGSLLVVVGEYDLTSDVENLKPIQKPVKRMIIHRNYNPLTFENDIALMELESPFDIQPHVVPICLPEPNEDFVDQIGYVAGWGKLSYGGPIPSILQVVRLPVLANKKCQEMFNEAGQEKEIKPTFLCAGFTDGGKDSCEGDSGGPLMVQRASGNWVLVGTVSHGIKCAEPNLPGVYMRTSSYRSWIDKIINKTAAKGFLN